MNIHSLHSYRIYAYTALFVIGMCLSPMHSLAATISASSGSALSAGDTAIIDVFLDTEGETLNSIDGSITLSDDHNGNFEVKDLSVVNSAFTMWPRKPSLEDKGKISFVGGIPGGIKGDHLSLFKIVVKVNQSGNFSIKPNTITSYLNDGLGTSRSIDKESTSITVGPAREKAQDKWQEIVSNDNTAPEPFTIQVVQDSYLYDGKKFISFETTDKQSGISYYEVKEGNRPPVRTGTSYVLINQNGPVDVVVTAYDKAGNFQVAVMSKKKAVNWIVVLEWVALISVLYLGIKKVRRKKTHAQ